MSFGFRFSSNLNPKISSSFDKVDGLKPQNERETNGQEKSNVAETEHRQTPQKKQLNPLFVDSWKSHYLVSLISILIWTDNNSLAHQYFF